MGAFAASIGLFICCDVTLAGSLSVTPISIDRIEGPEAVALPDVTVTFGNNLAYQDQVTVSMAGAEPTLADGYPSLVACALASPATPSALGFLSADASGWNFRVISPAGIVPGDTCTFRGFKIARSSIGETCTLTVSYEAKTFIGGYVIDAGGPAAVANVSPCGPPPPQIIEVAIDIRPGTIPNAINTSSKGNIPVAILSSSTFYAPADMDLGFPLMFGGSALNPSLRKCNTSGEDVNNDGLVDLVCHFDTQATAFQVSDTVGFVVGRAVNGAYVIGSDSVRIVK